MKSFQQFFEDFNNWRKPVDAVISNRNTTWSGSEPTGFKGAEGLFKLGRMSDIDVKLPKETSPKNHRDARSRKLRQKKLLKAYKQDRHIDKLSQDI